MKIERPSSKQPMPEHAERVFEGVMFDVYKWEQELFDGSVATFEKLKRKDTVIIVPSTPEGKILVLDEEQPGKEPFLAMPGGQIDDGESMIEAAKRELLEETGCVSEEWSLWMVEQPISKIDWAIYFLIAKNCVRKADLSLDGGEKLEIKMVDFDGFLGLACESRFSDIEIQREVMKARIDSLQGGDGLEKLRERLVG